MNIVIGVGEIGTAVGEVLKRQDSVVGRGKEDPGFKSKGGNLHICYPYSETFVKDTKRYIRQYKPKTVIVYSTTPIGTCEKIGKDIVHSPVEGKHPHLEDSILIMPRWIGVKNKKARERAFKLWRPYVKVIRLMASSRYTEFLKLRSTAKFGINLVWTDYEKAVADRVGINFSAVKEFDQDYNNLYKELGLDEFQRYILDPPNGVIGGHCLVPNAEMLNQQYFNPWLTEITNMEKK